MQYSREAHASCAQRGTNPTLSVRAWPRSSERAHAQASPALLPLTLTRSRSVTGDRESHGQNAIRRSCATLRHPDASADSPVSAIPRRLKAHRATSQPPQPSQSSQSPCFLFRTRTRRTTDNCKQLMQELELSTKPWRMLPLPGPRRPAGCWLLALLALRTRPGVAHGAGRPREALWRSGCRCRRRPEPYAPDGRTPGRPEARTDPGP